MFAKRRSLAQQRYAQFVAEGIKTDSPWSGLKGQVFLGDEQFVTRMQKLIRIGKEDVQIPLAQRRPQPPISGRDRETRAGQKCHHRCGTHDGGLLLPANRRLLRRTLYDSGQDCSGRRVMSAWTKCYDARLDPADQCFHSHS